MNLAWLAAVLAPRHVASELESVDPAMQVSGPARLAAVILGKQRSTHRSSMGEAASTDFVTLVANCLKSDTVAVSVADLGRRLTDTPPNDLAESASLALVLCSAAAELDEYDTGLQVLDQHIRRLSHERTSDATLLMAALSQQRALRLRDAGREFVSEVFKAGDLVWRVDAANCSAFGVESRVSASSTETIERILADLMDAAVSLLPRQEVNVEAFVERARSFGQGGIAGVKLQNRVAERRAYTYSAHVQQAFSKQFRKPGQTVIGGSAPDLFYELLTLELFGHGAVYALRKELALLRLVQGYGGATEMSDTLRLLRQSGAKKELDLVLRRLRDAGPLAVLSFDARQILRARLAPERLRVTELRVLEASADILAPTEASVALDAVLASLLAGGPPDPAGTWQALTLRKESAWRAAAALSAVCSRTNEVLSLLLEEARRQEEEDQLLDGALAKALRMLDWRSLPESLAQTWRELAEGRADILPATSEFLMQQLGDRLPESKSHSTLDHLIFKLNAALRDGVTDSALIAEGVPLARQEMERIRSTALQGVYSTGGIHPADVAAALIGVSNAVDLWPDLSNFLLDARVQRDDRTPGFERLVRSRPPLPREVEEQFSSRAARLIDEAGVGFLEPQTVPYPAALRFIAAYNLIGDADLYDQIARLAGSSASSARREAASTIAAIAGGRSQSGLIGLALPLSRDDDATVRANAGRALAAFAGSSDQLSSVALRRLADLLAEDGLVTPLLVLRGLGDNLDALERLPGEVYAQIGSMSNNHPSRLIRAEASRVLGLGPALEGGIIQ